MAGRDDDGDDARPRARHMSARHPRKDDQTDVQDDFDEVGVHIPGAREREREAVGQKRAASAKRHRIALRAKLGEGGTMGLAVMGQWHMGAAAAPGMLAGAFLAVVTATTKNEREEAFTAMAAHPELVSTQVAPPRLRSALGELVQTAVGQRLRAVIFPMILRYALRLGWTDVVAETRTNDAVRDAHAFMQRLHTRAMVHVVTLLTAVVKRPLAFVETADAPGLRRSQREYLLADYLASRNPEWRRRMETMLSCTPQALWARRARDMKRRRVRDTKRQDSRIGKP
jgi:hypothetical protein